MAGFLIGAPNENVRTSCGVNAVLANGASAAAARTAAKAAKPAHLAGEIPDTLIDAWTATQVSASDLTLPSSATATWIEGSVPALGLSYRGR